MKRLRETPASSPLIDQAQRLIEAAPPIPESSVKMQRIRRALDEPRPSGAGPLLRVPALALAGALLVVGASAFAAVRSWVGRLGSEPAAATVIEAPTAPQDPPARNRALPVPEAAPQLLAAADESTRARALQPTREANRRLSAADEPAGTRAQSTRRSKQQLSAAEDRVRTRVLSDLADNPSHGSPRQNAIRAARSAASRVPPPMSAPTVSRTAAPPRPAATVTRATPPPKVAAVASQAAATPTVTEATDELAAIPEPARLSRAAKRSSDSELVVRAVQMLRRDHDPVPASRLLERYCARNPAGVLAEEVLSLQIEAAVAAEDPRARSFAREYLARYPDGRYRERAARALEGGAP